MIDNIALYDPTKTMKFAMSSNNLLESTNVIYAYCDFTHLYNEIAKLTNWRKWEQYVIIGGRIGGTFMTDLGKYNGCIKEGKEAGNGYDMGLCAGKIVTLFLDSIL